VGERQLRTILVEILYRILGNGFNLNSIQGNFELVCMVKLLVLEVVHCVSLAYHYRRKVGLNANLVTDRKETLDFGDGTLCGWS